jgi:hypothetical protein
MTELEEFNDWKANPITKQFFTSIANRIYDIQVDLGTKAGLEPIEDARKSGAIIALSDILDTQYEDTK